jgi:thioredoxin-like negative regulator of GroEL
MPSKIQPKDGGKLPNREELLQMAISAAKNGQEEGARMMFRQILDQDKRNERAMMWLAQLAENPAEREQWLKNALQVNPENVKARRILDQMQYKSAAGTNRVLVIFGAVVAVLAVVLVVVLLLVFSGAIG